MNGRKALALLIVALALTGTAWLMVISVRAVQGDGPYPIPNGGDPDNTLVMTSSALALSLGAWPDEAQHNFYIFDPVSHSFTGYRFNPPDYPWLTGIYSMAIDSTSTCVACSYTGGVDDCPELCIGSLASGDIVFSVEAGYFEPEIILTAGHCGSTQLAVGVDPYYAELFFFNFTEPGLLGEITLPSDYRSSFEWTGRTSDYDNHLPSSPYFHFSSSTSTLFLPLPHLGLIYWCQIDLSSGFSYQDGTIPCGVDPTFITAPLSGTPLYVLDDQANEIFVLDPATRAIVKDISYESGTLAIDLIEHEGYLYLSTTSMSFDPLYGSLVKIDPVSEQQWSVDFVDSSPGDLSAFGGGIYVVKCTGLPGGVTPTLVEYDTSTLTQQSETFICSGGWSMDIIPQAGKGVICDFDSGDLFVVTL